MKRTLSPAFSVAALTLAIVFQGPVVPETIGPGQAVPRIVAGHGIDVIDGRQHGPRFQGFAA